MRRSLAAATLAALAAACTGPSAEDGGGTFRPSFAPVECPGDVSVQIVANHSCGYLTVLEDRDDWEGRTIRVFVTRVTPSGELAPDPYVIVGGDLGDATKYGGFAPSAERVGRELIMIDPRGIGHSRPSLVCPEVDELSIAVLEAPADDPAMREAFVDAVGACYARVTADGTDPSRYSIEDVAADVPDLRDALGVERWNVAAHGTASLIAFEVARIDPEGVRGLFLDSPDVPQVDPFTQAIEGTAASFEALTAACADDRACSREFDDLDAAIDEALARLDTSPVTVHVPAEVATAGPADVVVDDVRFLAVLRAVISDGGSSGGAFVPGVVPLLVRQALDGRFPAEPGGTIPNIVDDQPYCTGALPKCTALHRYTYGALLSYVCRDVAPFVDPDALEADAPDEASRALFARSPFLAACDRWEVEPADRQPTSLPDVGALVLLGGIDPYAHPTVVRDALAEMDHATIVEVPAETHNLSVIRCAFELRRRWLDDPSAAVDPEGCGRDLEVRFTLGT